MVRSLIERFSRGKSFRRRLPARFGGRPLYLSPDAALSYLKLNWSSGSRTLLSAAERFVEASNIVWDIGGNVGVFTFASAHIVGSDGEVVTVEADPFLASLLQKSAMAHANSDLNVNVICAAVSNDIGLARFAIAKRGRASSSLEKCGHRSQAGGARYVQYVPTITLDSLLSQFRIPNVIKIDVEGAEAFVLFGAERVLTECRPIIYIEVGSEQNAAVTAEFRRHGYRLYNGDSDDEAELDGCAWNTLAIPNESTRTNRRA